MSPQSLLKIFTANINRARQILFFLFKKDQNFASRSPYKMFKICCCWKRKRNIEEDVHQEPYGKQRS